MCSSFGCWELSQVIFLKLAEKERTEQTHKMTTIFTQKRQPRTILSEKSCQFMNVLSSHHEQNHLTRLPTAKN